MTTVPIIGNEAVFAAVSPRRAIEAVQDGFVKHHRGEWSMPSKVYLQSPPYGDFRAMPARGDGVALLKWVTSFPGNPQHGRPVVFGTILLSSAETGEPLAIIDGRAVTALRTGASAAVATTTLGAKSARHAGLVGCGLHGRWAALCLSAAGLNAGVCFDLNEAAARAVAKEVGWSAGSLEEALACDVVTLVTPGLVPVVEVRHLRPGMHINALGADGSGKAEMQVDAVAACRVFCDEWAQASHGGELHGAVEAGSLTRDDVTEIGAVIEGGAPGRASDDETTLFDSTGLAIQDLAVALVVLEAHKNGRIEAPTVDL
ncbi:MAG: ornithine cyclodeaminase family protein [Actinobacteria bacterium]|nr:ornithine cyclodeaminase family protein [Actinomycetota bacterium]